MPNFGYLASNSHGWTDFDDQDWAVEERLLDFGSEQGTRPSQQLHSVEQILWRGVDFVMVGSADAHAITMTRKDVTAPDCYSTDVYLVKGAAES